MQIMQRIRDYKTHLHYYIGQYLQPGISKSWKYLFIIFMLEVAGCKDPKYAKLTYRPGRESSLVAREKYLKHSTSRRHRESITTSR